MRGLVAVGLALLSLVTAGPVAWATSHQAMIKVARGTAWVERAGQRYAAQVAFAVREGDILLTGSDGAMGITFSDNSLISLGPGSKLGILRYAYDPVTRIGKFESTLYWGTMSATSGRVAPLRDGMSVTTPHGLYRIHGTEMVIRVEGGP